MVKAKNSKKSTKRQTGKANPKITAETPYGECRERLTAFGGLIALVKLFDLLGFEEAFEQHYVSPGRRTKLGCYRMISGIIILLFIGFQRLGHFTYIRTDSMVCGVLNVRVLPAISTFWRYLSTLGVVQSQSLIRLSGILRRRLWSLCRYYPRKITVNIDTTVATVYGSIQGACKGHNTKHRGKKGLRSVLLFIEQTREYLCGSQRRGETISSREVVYQIKKIRSLIPECVTRIHVKGDGEFISSEALDVCEEEGFDYTFANKRCKPNFSDRGWYRWGEYEYNQTLYQAEGWTRKRRFVVMRIHKDRLKDRQLKLFKEDTYAYRVFVTSLQTRPHKVIADYDNRADAENLINEAQTEGILAIPSKRFSANHAFFQIVMLSFNLWRWMKMLGSVHHSESNPHEITRVAFSLPDVKIRTARLKMLFIAAKLRFHSNRNEVLYSIHDVRTEEIKTFLGYLDKRRKEVMCAA